MRIFLSRPSFAIVVAFACAAGCQQNAAKPPAPKPAEVVVSTAIKKDVIDYEDFTGTLDAFQKVEITSRATGYLDKIDFVEGGMVKKGQVLFVIDPRPAKAELDRADAAVVQAEARFRRLNGDYQRAQELLRSRSTSKEEFEKVAGDFEEAKAAVGVAAASRKAAQLQLDFTNVLAPIDGRAGRTMLHEGNLVKADSTMLTVIVSQDPIHAYFDVDERTFLKLQRLAKETASLSKSATPRIRVGMELADEQGFPRSGEVDFEDNAIDTASGTKRLRAVFENKNGMLVPGMFVRIRFQIGSPRPAVIVREEGVGTNQGQKFVFIVDAKNEIVERRVKVGVLENGWRVIEEGVSVGDRIVVKGLQRVRPMMKVEPIEQQLTPAKNVRETPVNLPKEAKQ